MKPKTLILMVVAVTCGLGASYMTSRLLAQRGQSESNDKVVILVAAKDINQGSSLKNPEEAFEKKEFLRGSEPKEAITSFDEIKNKVLKRTLRAGDAVTQVDLLPEGMVGLSGLMATGFRAIGVRVNLESTAGGFASLPLSRVDIFSTVRRGSDRESFAQVLLENVLVLAVDSNKDRDDQGRAMPGNVVTLALKPEDILKVNLAKEHGPLSLALRKFRDETKTEVDRLNWEQILTKATGKEEEEIAQAPGMPPVAKKPVLPSIPVEDPKPAVVTVTEEPKAIEDPKHKVHVLTITEGAEQKQVTFYLDDKGEVIPRDVSRSELPAAPPRPTPAVTPPRPEGTTPPASPGKKD